MHTSGGRVSTVIAGVVYSARGEISLNPSSITVDVGTNWDGTNFRTAKPKAITAELTFDKFVDLTGAVLKWDDSLMLQTNLAVTFTETDTGLQHLISNACFVGEPTVNLSTGEVTGLKIAGDTYKAV